MKTGDICRLCFHMCATWRSQKSKPEVQADMKHFLSYPSGTVFNEKAPLQPREALGSTPAQEQK